MKGEFDDILGEDVLEMEVLEMEDKDITDDAPELDKYPFERVNDAYEKSQKRWEMEAEVKEELKERFEEAERKLMEQKKAFEKGTDNVSKIRNIKKSIIRNGRKEIEIK